MSEYTSPVPVPALDATAPEVYRDFYGMPMFVIVPTPDLAASADFWIRGLGFIDLFSIPDQVTPTALGVPGRPPRARGKRR